MKIRSILTSGIALGSIAFVTSLTAATNTKFTIETAGDVNSPDAIYIAKDGQPFFAKGVAYSAVPLGASFHYTPQIGDWFYGPWQQIPEKDFALMGDMGINCIRTYAFWYWQSTNNLTTMRSLTQSSPMNATGGNDPFNERDGFFQAMEDNGVYGILGIALDGSQIFNGGTNDVKLSYANFYLQTAEKLASEYGDQPNVMGFCIANEQNQAPRNKSAYVWAYYYEMAKRVRKGLGDNQKLITIAWQNDVTLYNNTVTVDMSDSVIAQFPSDNKQPAVDLKTAAQELRENLIGWEGGDDYSAVPVEMIISTICDFWGLNIYAGMETSLATYKTNVFEKAYRKPLIVTEWGHSATINDPETAKGPPENNAKLKEKSEAGRQAAASGINSDILAMNEYLAFCNGGTYFEWVDEWWKNDSYWDLIPLSQQQYLDQQIANWKEGDPVPQYNTDANGKINFETKDGIVVANGFPQYTFVWDGTDAAEWPEEGWGLHSVSANGRQAWDNPWNLNANKPYPVDNRTERPLLVQALMGSTDGAYPGKGYPFLEANLNKLINKEEAEGWHYMLSKSWAYDNDEQEFVYLVPLTGSNIYTYNLNSMEWSTLDQALVNDWAYITQPGWAYAINGGWTYLQGPDGSDVYVLDQDGAYQYIGDSQ